MKVIATLSFGILIFLLTCTENVQELVFYQHLHFKLNPNPDFTKFLNFTGYPFGSPLYFTQKIGHGLFFFLFSFLLNRVTNKFLIVIPISIGYALITEIAQVYFSRTGCLLDVFYDSVGIFSYFALRVLLSQKKHYPIEPNG